MDIQPGVPCRASLCSSVKGVAYKQTISVRAIKNLCAMEALTGLLAIPPRTRYLLLVCGSSRGSHTSALKYILDQAMKDAVREHGSGEALSNYCSVYQVSVLQDNDVRSLVDEIKPDVVVTTGRHLMQLLLNGEESLSLSGAHGEFTILQDIESLHGRLLPAHSSWGPRGKPETDELLLTCAD